VLDPKRLSGAILGFAGARYGAMTVMGSVPANPLTNQQEA
jgi:hypothetical protein